MAGFSLRMSRVLGGAAPSPVKPRSIPVCGGQRMSRPSRQHLGGFSQSRCRAPRPNGSEASRTTPGGASRNTARRIISTTFAGGRHTRVPFAQAMERWSTAGFSSFSGGVGEDHADPQPSFPHPAVEEAVIGSDLPPHLLLVAPDERPRSCRRRLDPYWSRSFPPFAGEGLDRAATYLPTALLPVQAQRSGEKPSAFSVR